MSPGALLSVFFGSMLGALIPIINVEVIVAVAARQAGDGIVPLVAVSFAAAAGTMVGKLQVYAVARGGRALGGRWVRRKVERETAEALEAAAAREEHHAADAIVEAAVHLEDETTVALQAVVELTDEARARSDAEEADLDAHPDAPHSLRRRAWAQARRLLAGPGIEKLGAGMVLVSALVGIPPFAVVAAVAGAARMRWWVFALAGLAGRFVRFAIVYEAAARTLGG